MGYPDQPVTQQGDTSTTQPALPDIAANMTAPLNAANAAAAAFIGWVFRTSRGEQAF